MDQVDFEPAKQWSAVRLQNEDCHSTEDPPTRSVRFVQNHYVHIGYLNYQIVLICWSISLLISDLGGLIPKPPVIIRSGGGIHNYLYKLSPSADVSGQTKFQGSNILGKFQITWRTNLGEPGRLQTQQILGAVSSDLYFVKTRREFVLNCWLFAVRFRVLVWLYLVSLGLSDIGAIFADTDSCIIISLSKQTTWGS